MNTSTPELLAPAGGPEQLRAAIRFGADAVYLAGKRWGMRARANNFDDKDLAWAIAYAHERGVAVHVTINTMMFDNDIDELPVYLERLDDLGVDAAIVADFGALVLLRRHAPHVAAHVSTQASVSNAEAALAYARLGASRIVLARELTLERIAELHRRVGDAVELEAFVHGSMCMAVSGRCLLSSALVGPERSASCGNCTQPCRWTWSLTEETRPDQPMPLEADSRGSYLLSANDLCMLDHLDELADAGVASLKIEGRNKGAYYVAAVTNAYRHVLDGEPASAWMGELEATSHRPFSTGFYFGKPTQNPGHAEYERERLLVAVANGSERCGDAWVTTVTCRNRAVPGDVITVLAPHQPLRSFVLGEVERLEEAGDECGAGRAGAAERPGAGERTSEDERIAEGEQFDNADQSGENGQDGETAFPNDNNWQLWQPADRLAENMRRYRLQMPFELHAGDMLCK
ncbi:MAG: U32 family peptidase [Atopobiaceae bacterium]|nr:U32 family peptidase [Atopobiaceae bacterium]